MNVSAVSVGILLLAACGGGTLAPWEGPPCDGGPTTPGGGTWRITLRADPPSGAPVGTPITWTAVDPNAHSYRFAVRSPDGRERILRDFDQDPRFEWAPLDEGRYQITVTARNGPGGALRSASTFYTVRSRLGGAEAVVSPTRHPLVALYSAPPCSPGASVRVQYRASDEQRWQVTPAKPCRPDRSVNILVAGMRPTTRYTLRHEVLWGDERQPSAPLTFITGAPELPLPERMVIDPPDERTSRGDDVIVHAFVFSGPTQLACPVATDLAGRLLWYYKEPCDPRYLGSIVNSFPPNVGGTFLMHMSRPTAAGPIRGQLLREIDVAGHTLRETNVDRINEQLEALGQDHIYYFHHDTRRLPNGHTLVLAGVERILRDVQGVSGPVDVVGDMVLDLDEDWQLVWAWNSFDDPRLPIERRARRDEVCTGGAFNVCGPLRRLAEAPVAHDWTHGNAVTYTPEDGHFLVSFRHQDWVVKVDYADGRGSGRVLWRLGQDGDFTLRQRLPQPEPNPWFSGQHQPMVYARSELVLYDNANALREAGLATANSRGQVLLLDERARVAELRLSVDLGVYAPFLGSAQKLANGDYHFLSGGIGGEVPSPMPGPPAGYSQSTEVDAAGRINYILQAQAVTYRSFRMRSLYQPAGIPGDVDGDSDVDAKDLNRILKVLGQPPRGPFDPRDVDASGHIDVADVLAAHRECTLSGCRSLNWESPVLGY